MNLYEHTIIARQDVSANDLKKIEEKWINNDFKISEQEVVQVIEN